MTNKRIKDYTETTITDSSDYLIVDSGVNGSRKLSPLNLPLNQNVQEALDLKVDEVDGKMLTTNDLTNTLKSNYDAAYISSHAHSNKTILDGITNVGSGKITTDTERINWNGKADDNAVMHNSGVESINGQKTFNDGLASAKGAIFYGESTPFPTGIGSYIANYISPTYGARSLAYNGTSYVDYKLGKLISGSTFQLNLASDGTSTFGGSVSATNLSNTNTGDETNATIKTKLGVVSDVNDGYVTTVQKANWDAASTGSGAIKISSGDTTPSYLESKLTIGSGVQLYKQNDGGNENLLVQATSLKAYCVNYDKNNLNIYADFIYSKSNTSVGFKDEDITTLSIIDTIPNSGTIKDCAVSGSYTYVLIGSVVYTHNGTSWNAGVNYGGGTSAYICADANNVCVIDKNVNKSYISTNNASSFTAGGIFGTVLTDLCGEVSMSGNYIYINSFTAGGDSNKFFRSSNLGTSWSLITTFSGIGSGNYAMISIGSTGNEVYYLAKSNASLVVLIYYSSNNGTSFTQVSSISDFGSLFLFGGSDLSVDGNKVAIVDYTNNNIYISTNKAISWYKKITSSTIQQWTGSLNINTNGTIIIAGGNNIYTITRANNPKLLLTFPNNRKTYCVASIADVTGLASETHTYNFIIKESNLTLIPDTYETINGVIYPTYSAVATAVDTTTYGIPTQAGNPSTSYTYYLDTTYAPDILTSKELVGGIFVDSNFVNIGEVTITSSIMGTPITYAFNGKYISADTACVTTANTPIVYNHNIGVSQVRATNIQLRCVIAEQGYSIGDVVVPYWNIYKNSTAGTYANTLPYLPAVDKTTVTYGVWSDASSGWTINRYILLNKSTLVSYLPTTANWKQFTTVERSF